MAASSASTGAAGSEPGSMQPEFLSNFVGTPESNESSVRNGFWDKARKVLNRVQFLEDAVAMYFCAIDTENTPKRVRMAIFAALAYFILPTDLVADFIPIAGYADDAVVITKTIQHVSKYITDEHRQHAKDSINRKCVQVSNLVSKEKKTTLKEATI